MHVIIVCVSFRSCPRLRIVLLTLPAKQAKKTTPNSSERAVCVFLILPPKHTFLHSHSSQTSHEKKSSFSCLHSCAPQRERERNLSRAKWHFRTFFALLLVSLFSENWVARERKKGMRDEMRKRFALAADFALFANRSAELCKHVGKASQHKCQQGKITIRTRLISIVCHF